MRDARTGRRGSVAEPPRGSADRRRRPRRGPNGERDWAARSRTRRNPHGGEQRAGRRARGLDDAHARRPSCQTAGARPAESISTSGSATAAPAADSPTPASQAPSAAGRSTARTDGGVPLIHRDCIAAHVDRELRHCSRRPGRRDGDGLRPRSRRTVAARRADMRPRAAEPRPLRCRRRRARPRPRCRDTRTRRRRRSTPRLPTEVRPEHRRGTDQIVSALPAGSRATSGSRPGQDPTLVARRRSTPAGAPPGQPPAPAPARPQRRRRRSSPDGRPDDCVARP